MTDLTCCYLHMSDYELKALDTLETPSYMNGVLSDDADVVLPPDMIPPNPEEHESLPSQAHPSYPFGNPTNIKHPASRPPQFSTYDPTMKTRALFEDMGLAPATVDSTVRWKELALDELLPIDEAKILAQKALAARKLASGVPSNAPGQGASTRINDDNESSNDEDNEDEEDSTDQETDQDE